MLNFQEKKNNVGTRHSPRKFAQKRVKLLPEIRNNVIPRTMAIVYSADMPHSGDQKKLGARKRENADGDGDKMKCNGSHSTATDRSFFQRISRTARNFGPRREEGGKKAALFCKRRDARPGKKCSRQKRSITQYPAWYYRKTCHLLCLWSNWKRGTYKPKTQLRWNNLINSILVHFRWKDKYWISIFLILFKF